MKQTVEGYNHTLRLKDSFRSFLPPEPFQNQLIVSAYDFTKWLYEIVFMTQQESKLKDEPGIEYRQKEDISYTIISFDWSPIPHEFGWC